MPFCSKNISVFCSVISVWAIIQLFLMGVFFYTKSVALAEDLPIPHEGMHSVEEFYSAVDEGYTQNAYNCWVAACLYVVTLLVSLWQFMANKQTVYQV